MCEMRGVGAHNEAGVVKFTDVSPIPASHIKDGSRIVLLDHTQAGGIHAALRVRVYQWTDLALSCHQVDSSRRSPHR